MSSPSDFRTTIFRTLLTSTACCLCILAFLSISRDPEGIQASAVQGSRDADVILITIDTTRADHLSCYGPRGAKTPHLDALAARGVRFTHATAQVPLTLPSHACIMTGTYPAVNGLRDMGGFILEKNHPTIASIAHSAGFETAAFVGSRVLSKHFGFSNGFATYDDDMSGKTEEGLPGVFPERRASVVTDRSLAWLKKNETRKFFLWVHYYDPHAPYDPPEPYKHTYARDLYSGEIANTDEQVGRLLDGIGRAGLNNRTLIVVIGDHGESLGEHGEMTHGVFLYDSTRLRKVRFLPAEAAEAKYGEVPLLLVRPGTWMNLSGPPIASFARRRGAGNKPLAARPRRPAHPTKLRLSRDTLSAHVPGLVRIARDAHGRMEADRGSAAGTL